MTEFNDGGSLEDALYRRIVEKSPDAVVFGDSQGIIRIWNAGAEQTSASARRRRWASRWTSSSPSASGAGTGTATTRSWPAASAATAPGDLLAVPAVTKDGRTISIEFTIQMLKGPSGEILGPVAVIRDVTKRFQREKEMARRIKELAHPNP